jgi:hypothetical protein
MRSLVGMKVRVYFNTHKDCLSVQHKGKVIAHVKSISLEDVVFKVSESGRQRALREGRKNVHAYVCGKVISKTIQKLNMPVTYNPYQYTQFAYKASKQPINNAKECQIRGKDVYV